MRANRTFAGVILPLLAILEISAGSRGFGEQAAGGRQAAEQTGPAPSFADLDYASADPASSNGHKLDLYIPDGARSVLPVILWTAGSAWLADTGKRRAETIAAQLNPRGYAVAGVSIRSSSQVKFPGQLHDIKAAIR